MEALPVMLRVRDRLCVVVGGGKAAYAKAQVLLRAGARLRVVAPVFHPQFHAHLVQNEKVEFRRRAFRPDDLDGAWAVFVMETSSELQMQVFRLAEERRVLCYAMDNPACSHMTAPAIAERGPIVIAVATSGASPRMAQILRDRVVTVITEGDVRLVEFLGQIRARIKAVEADPARRKTLFDRIIASPIPQWLVEGREDAAWAELEAILAAESSRHEG